MNVYWRPHHEVYPELAPDQDVIAFDEATEDDVGRVYVEKHSANVGRWKWSMYAHSTTGRVPFEISGYENTRGDAGHRVVEIYRTLLEHNARYPRGIRDLPGVE